MQFQLILAKIRGILKYPQRRGKQRLYQQWVERAGLPPEAVPEEEVAEDIIPKVDKKVDKIKLNQKAPYILLGAVTIIFIVALILVSSC